MSIIEDRPSKLSDTVLDQLFRSAHTHYAWHPKDVSDEELRDLYDLVKMGPTSANGSPARILFLKSEASKSRLYPCLSPTNIEKVRTAPVTAIVAYDIEFYEKLPKLFPHTDARAWFSGRPEFAEETAFRNSSLQGAYLILAARALGLDCGPMSGFDPSKVNDEFFPDGKWKVNFICNLGYGDEGKAHARNPRLDFEEACLIL